MNPSAPFILRPIMTTLIMVAVLIVGTYSYNRLPVSNLPDVNFPTITVTVPFPGANPQIMANTVATPLEKKFMTIPGIKSVVSNNTLGLTQIILQFQVEKNIDLAAVDVETAINQAVPFLPPNLPQTPTYKKVNPGASPIIYLSVTSPTLTQGELYDYGNTFIGQRISIIEGVADVGIYGSPYAVRAQIDPGLVSSFGLTMQDIANTLETGNQYQPLGQFDGNNTASIIYDNGGLYTASEYKPLIAAYRNGSPVRIKNLGKVVDSLQNDRSSRRYVEGNIDMPCVTLAILTQPGANVVNVADTIKKQLPVLMEELPGGVDLHVIFDRSESIKASFQDIKLTLIIAFILVVLVIFIYLGKVRETIIPSLVMPMAVIATFAVIYPLGYTLDNLSMLALTLAIGFIIDDAIVVLENIVRKVENGETPLNASLQGSRQISFTIISMTLSLIAVFIPLIFMAGIIGKLFQEFALTLTIITLLSGIISLTLTPMLCSLFIPAHSEIHKGKIVHLSERFNASMLNYYKQALNWILEHRLVAITVGVLSIFFSLVLFKILPTDFIPDEDIGFIIAYTEADQGTSSDQMRIYQKEVLSLLRKEPSIAALMSVASTPQYRQGLILLKLVPRNARDPITKLIQQYNQKLQMLPGVNVYLKNIPLIDLNIGSQVRGAYQFLMQSLDSKELYQSAEALMEKMKQDLTFNAISTDLEIRTPQITMDIQRDLASTLGITAESFEQGLFLGYSGNRISRIQSPIDQYDVIVELDRNLQRNPSSLNLIYLRSSTTNQLVPLSAVANWKEKVGPQSVNHFAQFPAVTITFNIAPDVSLSEAIAKLREYASITLSPRVSGNVKGAAEIFEEAIQSISLLLLITILAIYIVLGILYESFVHPLTILSTLPPALLGALLTLYIFNMPLSLYAYLGLILLIGIVKKNGIMMVDFALDNIREKGENAEQSIYHACLTRFRPIMMTTVAAIMGAIPIALGTESRRPLGYVIIGGLLVSQLITLFLTPVIYLYFERIRERFVSKF